MPETLTQKQICGTGEEDDDNEMEDTGELHGLASPLFFYLWLSRALLVRRSAMQYLGASQACSSFPIAHFSVSDEIVNRLMAEFCDAPRLSA